jgi:hypothetical protein
MDGGGREKARLIRPGFYCDCDEAVELCEAALDQTISATFGNTAFKQTISATFGNAAFKQTISATFGNAAFDQTISATFGNAAFDQAISATFSNTTLMAKTEKAMPRRVWRFMIVCSKG